MDLNDAEHLAWTLMREWEVLPEYSFEFDRGKRRFGACHYRIKTITLSAPLTAINDEARVRDVILHEIAHALAGPGAGHGPLWRKIARSVGANPDRCYDSTEVNMPEGKYKAVCPSCGYTTFAYRRRKKRIACTKCCRKYSRGRFDSTFELIFLPNVPDFVPPVAKMAAHSVKSPAVTKSGNLCRDCGAVIPPTGKRGRPAVRCVNCR